MGIHTPLPFLERLVAAMTTAIVAPVLPVWDTVHESRVSRLMQLYGIASESIRDEGRSWYSDQREVIRELSLSSGFSVNVVAAVVSALSPQTPWERNIAGAVRIIRAFRLGEDAPPRNVTVYYINALKAWKLLRGDVTPEVAFANAPKTRAFWRNLSGDEGEATVDMWMVRAAGHSNTGTVQDGKITPKVYREIAAAVTEAAAVVGEPVAQFQAIVWLVVRSGQDREVAA